MPQIDKVSLFFGGMTASTADSPKKRTDNSEIQFLSTLFINSIKILIYRQKPIRTKIRLSTKTTVKNT